MDLQDFLITQAISVVLFTLKNPARKAKFKAAMLKVRNYINAAFAGDPDFGPQP